MARVLHHTADLSVTTDHRLGLVTDFARALERAQSVSDVVGAGAASLHGAVAADAVAIGKFDAAQGAARILCSVGDPGRTGHPTSAGGPYRLTQHPLMHVLAGTECWSYNAGQADRIEAEERFLAKAGRSAHLAAPIMVGGLVWGGVYASRSLGRDPFTADDLQLTTVMTTLIAAGLAQAERIETLAILATTDPMTGLANRRAVDEAMESALEASRDSGEVVSVMLCDVDGLKRVNDEFGHAAGDLLLNRVASLLTVASARLPGAIAGRIGGDEFALLAPGVDTDRLVEVATEMCEAARSLPFGGGVSCGAASSDAVTGPDANSMAKALYRRADSAQYRAKRAGGGHISVEPSRESTVDGHRLRVLPSRRATDVPGQLRDCIASAVSTLNDAENDAALDRLAVLADVVARQCNAAGWYLLSAHPGDDTLVARASDFTRLDAPAQDPRNWLPVGSGIALADYALSAGAVRGGAFSVSIDEDDPSTEREALLESGNTGIVAAGGTDGSSEGWLVLIYVDEASELPAGADLPGMASVLRSLVALALAPVLSTAVPL